jgi:hypothetical protein
MKSQRTSLLLLLSLALSGCQSLPPPEPVVRYLKPERPEVPGLEPALRRKREPTSCLKLLQQFSASPGITDSLCGTTTASSNDSTPVAPLQCRVSSTARACTIQIVRRYLLLRLISLVGSWRGDYRG